MSTIRQQALDKMLKEMNDEHTDPEDRIHNWLCDQEDEKLFAGINESEKCIRNSLEYCSEKAREMAVNQVAVVDDNEVFKWVYEYFTTPIEKATKKKKVKPSEKEVKKIENDSKKVATKHANKKKVVPIQEEGEQLSLLDFL